MLQLKRFGKMCCLRYLLLCSILCIKTFTVSAVDNSRLNDIAQLTLINDVKLSIQEIMQTDVGIDRIGLSELFLVNGARKAFITDATGTVVLEASSVRYIPNENVKTVHYGNNEIHTLSNFYHFATSGVLPEFGSSTKGRIVVFMDPTCPNCVNFHNNEMFNLTQKGYSFVYVPSLRDGSSNRNRETLLAHYCSDGSQYDNVQTLYSNYRMSRERPLDRSQCLPVEESMYSSIIDVFARHQMLGSPAFMLSSGEIIYGAAALKSRLK